MTDKPKERLVSYEELLRAVVAGIEAKFGSVKKFLESEDYTRWGFRLEERQKMYSYLSIPRGGGKKTVKSLPTLSKLALRLLKVRVKYATKVRRETEITVDSPI